MLNIVIKLILFLLVLVVVLFVLLFQVDFGPRSKEEALREKTYLEIRTTAYALEVFKSKYGVFPTTKHGLRALTDGHIDFLADWDGPITKQKNVTADAWGNTLFYESDGNTFQIISFGADGKSGGTGLEADLIYDSILGRDHFFDKYFIDYNDIPYLEKLTY